MRVLAVAIVLLATAGVAPAAAVEVIDVASETGGVWAPGRFSPVLVRVRATAGTHELRGRLETDKIAVTRFDSAGGEETVRLALLPERDATAVEIDAGDGFRSHAVRLRRVSEDRPIVGVVRSLETAPWLAEARAEHGWHEIVLPEDGGPAVLRDVCDAVVAGARDRAWLDRALERRTGGPRTGGPVVGRWLHDRAADARVRPARARRALVVLVPLTGLLLGLIALGRRGGWSAARLVAVVVLISGGAIALWCWIGATASAPPRVACRGYRLVRASGERTDFLVAAARGVETTDLRGVPGTILRPIPDGTGRIGPYVLEDGRVLRNVALGRGRLAYFRMDRDVPVDLEPGEISVEDGFVARADRARWLGRVALAPDTGLGGEPPTDPIADIWERFREKGGNQALSDRGRLLRKIVRPATRSGAYGFLPSPPALDAEAMRVETAELLWGIVIP